MISRLERASHAILVLNLLLLLSIGVIPFATDLMATYLTHGTSSERHLAAAVYSGTFLFMGLMFANLNRQIMFGHGHVLVGALSQEQRRLILGRTIAGLLPYAVAVGLAFVSAYASIIVCGVLALYYALPVASGR